MARRVAPRPRYAWRAPEDKLRETGGLCLAPPSGPAAGWSSPSREGEEERPLSDSQRPLGVGGDVGEAVQIVAHMGGPRTARRPDPAPMRRPRAASQSLARVKALTPRELSGYGRRGFNARPFWITGRSRAPHGRSAPGTGPDLVDQGLSPAAKLSRWLKLACACSRWSRGPFGFRPFFRPPARTPAGLRPPWPERPIHVGQVRAGLGVVRSHHRVVPWAGPTWRGTAWGSCSARCAGGASATELAAVLPGRIRSGVIDFLIRHGWAAGGAAGGRRGRRRRCRSKPCESAG